MSLSVALPARRAALTQPRVQVLDIALVPAVRLMRTVALGAAAAGLAGGAHALGGHSASPVVALAGCLITAAFVWPATVRRLSARRVVLTTVAVQSAMHAAFSLAEPARGAHMGMHMAMGAQMSSGMAGDGGVPRSTWLTQLVPGGSDLRMAGTHLVAAVVVGLWLAAGERVVFAAVESIARSVVLAAERVLTRSELRRLMLTAAVSAQTAMLGLGACLPRCESPPIAKLRERLVDHVVVRRGPPATGALTA